MKIGALVRRHGTNALLGLTFAVFSTATALAGSPPMPTVSSESTHLASHRIAVAKAPQPTQASATKAAKAIRTHRLAQAVPFFAFPPRI